MKKFLAILIMLGGLLIPNVASAASRKVNYYCDSKQALDDGTFYMTCHIIINSDMELNHVTGTFVTKNVNLQSIKTSSDWVNNNGTSLNVDFTSATAHKGSFSVADVIFTGNLSDTECEASFAPGTMENVVPDTPTPNKACAIVDNKYYGKNATEVSEVTYYEECCNYVCTVVNNKYYFNSKGKSVSYDAMLDDCNSHETVNPSTGIDFNYILIPAGIISIIAILKLANKNSKIYKI